MKDAVDFLKSVGINDWSKFTSSAKIIICANKEHKEKYPEQWNWGFLGRNNEI